MHNLLSLMGEAHLAVGDKSQAKSVLSKTLKSHPSHVATMIAYASLLRSNVSKERCEGNLIFYY